MTTLRVGTAQNLRPWITNPRHLGNLGQDVECGAAGWRFESPARPHLPTQILRWLDSSGSAAVVAAKAQFDCAGTSRHGSGACGAAGAAIFLSFALSSSESPWAPAQCASSRNSAARAFAASLWSRKGETNSLFNWAANPFNTSGAPSAAQPVLRHCSARFFS